MFEQYENPNSYGQESISQKIMFEIALKCYVRQIYRHKLQYKYYSNFNILCTLPIGFDVLSKVYADNEPFVYTVGLGTVHPMISHKLTNFINQTNCFTADGVLAIRTMLDGLAKHNGYNPPSPVIKDETKKATMDCY